MFIGLNQTRLIRIYQKSITHDSSTAAPPNLSLVSVVAGHELGQCSGAVAVSLLINNSHAIIDCCPVVSESPVAHASERASNQAGRQTGSEPGSVHSNFPVRQATRRVGWSLIVVVVVSILLVEVVVNVP